MSEEVVDVALSGGVDLKRLRSELKRSQIALVQTLIGLLESEDESIRLRAATTLATISIDVEKVIADDLAKRLILSIRQKNGLSNQQDVNRPLVDFTTIREVE